MKKWIKITVSLWLAAIVYQANSQNIPVESWRSHFSYNDIRRVEFGNNKVFAAAPHGICYFDQLTNSVNTLTKTDGLSGADITALKYNEDHKCLIIGYASGLIDIHQGGKVYTVSDFYNSQLLVSKRINDIVTSGNLAYVACGLGIIEISLQSKAVTNNFRSIGRNGADPNVSALAIHQNQLFATSDSTIYYGSLEDNLPDFNNWTHHANRYYPYRSLTIFNDQVHALENDLKIVRLNGSNWEYVLSSNTVSLIGLAAENQKLYAYSAESLYEVSGSTLQKVRDFDETINVIASNEGFWYGTKAKGLKSPDGTFINTNGPLQDKMTRIRFTGNKLYACYGPYPETFGEQTNALYGDVDSLGYDVFDNHEWSYQTIEGFYNISDVAAYRGNVYISSVGFGMYDLNNQQEITGINNSLDGLGPIIPELASGAYLYIPAYNNANTLYLLDTENNLTSYPNSTFHSQHPSGIAVSQGGTIWMQTSFRNHTGIMVFNPDEDNYTIIQTSDGLYSNTVNNIAIDNNDEAWVASLMGPSIFTQATYAFDDEEGIRPIFDNRTLFKSENISTIEIDGGNRVWMCTKDGIYVFDNNIAEMKYHFNTENSPLPSNDVLELAYNPANGEMFILTTSGLVSYRSNSSTGAYVHQNVNIYPNPVRPGYEGMVGISGLVTNASLKITDVNGKLIRQLKANGGSASWDLLDYNQRRVPSGVYVLLSSSLDGAETYIGKLAVIN